MQTRIKKQDHPPIQELIGEDRDFGGNVLSIDLLPQKCWFKGLRACLQVPEYTRLRNFLMGRSGNTCEYCRSKGKSVLQKWRYEEPTHTQRLVRFVLVCSRCGRASIRGRNQVKSQEANHMLKVREWQEFEYLRHEEQAHEAWTRRNATDWRVNIDLIVMNGLRLKTVIREAYQQQEDSYAVSVKEQQ